MIKKTLKFKHLDFVQSTKFCLGLGSRSIKIQSRNYHKLHWSAFLFLAVPTYAPVFFPRVQWRPSCIAERAQLFQLAAPLSLQLCYTVVHFLVWTMQWPEISVQVQNQTKNSSTWQQVGGGGGNKKIKLYIIKQWIIHYKTMTEKKFLYTFLYICTYIPHNSEHIHSMYI